jgi:RimJ/RimL family protein N-acetyltransferase
MNLTHDLVTRRLRLTPLTLDHVDAILEWANDPAVTGNSQFFREPSDRKRIARFILEHEDDAECAYFAAFVRDDCEERAIGYVGNVFLFKINHKHNHCQVGITIKQAAWNHGYAQELLPAILHFAFDEVGMNKVYLEVFTTNTKAAGLYRKLGFQDEGILRAHYFVNGAYHDMYSLSILGAEFAQRAAQPAPGESQGPC